jgi:hypothetical protein
VHKCKRGRVTMGRQDRSGNRPHIPRDPRRAIPGIELSRNKWGLDSGDHGRDDRTKFDLVLESSQRSTGEDIVPRRYSLKAELTR